MHKHGQITVISREELKEKIDNGEKFLLVEVLSREEYGQGHLPNAINIPLSELPERASKELEKEKEIIVYCSDFSCRASGTAAHFLLHMGYQNVKEFAGGKKQWVQAGYPIEKL
ncbi:MAG: rhodanese-like domain-containing protein [Candidatus ainarchaeum sp.]|nr:rhodanese-like domain-containing protein [Candidatus ainarchaeum sp.]